MGLLAFTHVATWALNGAGWVLAGHGWSSTVVDGFLSELTLLAPTVVCWLALSRDGLGGPQVLLSAAAMTLYLAGSTSFGFVGGAGSVPLPFVAEHGVLSFYPLISASHATVTPAKPALLACWPAQSNANPRSHARQRNVRRARTFESWSVTTTICLLSARSIPTIALLIGTNTRSRESGSPAITVVRERCAI